MSGPLPHLIALVLLAAPAAAQDCCLCGPADELASAESAGRRPLVVEVEGGLEFGRLALGARGGGEAVLVAGEDQAVTDGRLLDLGGLRYAATVRLTGQPGATVRVGWPDSLPLESGSGAPLRLEQIRSDRPLVLQLDAGGRTVFHLGARLVVPDGAGGDYRGRVTVDAEYL